MTKEKGGFLTPKAISNRIKAKGLQKLRWYCQMCQKQCRDENGYKCHTMSESHHRQMKLFAENGGKFISSFSSEFLKGYLDIVRRQFGGQRVHANVVYQEYIKDKEHIHMNATRWHTLTGLCMWLGKQGICKVDETEKGWFIEYIDRDPEKLKRQEASERLEKTEDEINRHFLEKQIEYNLSKTEPTEGPSYTPLVRPDDTPIRLNLSLKPKSSEKTDGEAPIEDRKVPEVVEQEEKPTNTKFITFGPKKAKPLNPLLAAEQKAKEQRSKSNPEKPKVVEHPQSTTGYRRKALDDLMEKEEALKDKRNRRDYWLTEGIEVKLVNRKLPEDVRLRHAAVVKMLDNYTAIVRVLRDGTKIKVDQEHVQTVVPPPSSTVMVVNGAYRGEYATLEQVDRDAGCCDLTIATGLCMGRYIRKVSLDDVCKLVEVQR
ncbi:CAMK protein kinase [Clonorchis sinensis]|uniref:CAMK protein kinase n=1 Tax=Clonorchis sinensis TaxID=79923 RepID=A0A8T1MQ62_CLOSI|nr:CAMK protein kinase [Clonorchis sinensis]